MPQTRKANTRKGYDQPGSSGDPHVRVSSSHSRSARPGTAGGKARRAMNRTQVKPDQRFHAD